MTASGAARKLLDALALDDRKQRAREAGQDAYPDSEHHCDCRAAGMVDDAIEVATRVRVDDDIVAAAREELRRQAFGWLDLRASRVIIAAAFRAAGFEVEE
jgi:hypothetical protein